MWSHFLLLVSIYIVVNYYMYIKWRWKLFKGSFKTFYTYTEEHFCSRTITAVMNTRATKNMSTKYANNAVKLFAQHVQNKVTHLTVVYMSII